MTPEVNVTSRLQEAVKRFEVCWEALPELSGANHERKPIGFVIELYGTHNRADIVPTAGCQHCIPVAQALLEIADFVVAQEWREAIDALRAHSGLEYAKERGGRPDVVVAITMIPRRDGAPDPNAIAPCLAKVKERLGQLGTSETAWRDTNSASRSA